MKKTEINLQAAQRLYHEGRLPEALETCQSILLDDPFNVDVLHFLGLVRAELGDYFAAQENLEKALSLDPYNLGLQLHLGTILKLQGLYGRAEQTFKNLIAQQPTFAAAFNNLGTVYYAQGKLPEALSAYQKAIDLQPNYVDAYYNLGLALNKSKQLAAAINVYRSLLELSPQHSGARFHLACLYLQQEKINQALQEFLLIEKKHPFHLETLINLANCYVKLGAIKEAQKHYLQALELAPHDPELLFNLAVLHGSQNELAIALQYYLKAIELKPDFFAAHNNIGVIYLQFQQQDKALEHFQQALRLQPGNASIQHTINILLQKKNINASPPEYIQTLFDAYAGHYEAHLLKTLKYNLPELMYAIVKRHCSHFDNVLDLGCGTGLCGELFKPIVHTLTGVDVSEKMLAMAADKKIYDKLLQEDMLRFLADKDGAYDLIIAGDVLVYFGDLTAVFAAVNKALKPNGLFIFNAEIDRDHNYRMSDSGRFMHHKKYLDELAIMNNFKTLDYQVVAFRTENNQAVSGHLYLLQN